MSIRPSYYRLELVPEQDTHGMIMTAAIMACSLCGETIDTMGGPGAGAVCQRCGDLVIAGKTVGAIVWTEVEGD